MFSRDTYVQRRARLAEQLDGGLLVFLGNSDSPMNYRDNIYHFRQDSAFLYYFGLDIPDLAAIVDLDAGRTTLFGNDPDIDLARLATADALELALLEHAEQLCLHAE